MSEPMTERQQQILVWIGEFIALNKFPPTRGEIAGAFGFASINAAEQHVRALETKGRITIAPGISRGIALVQKKAA